MIFGKRSVFYGVLLAHFLRIVGISQLIRLLGSVAVSYASTRREARQRSFLGFESVLRRMHGHIVAQAFGAEKFLPSTAARRRPHRLARALGQTGVAALVVIALGAAWPHKAAAPSALAVVVFPTQVVVQRPEASPAVLATPVPPPGLEVAAGPSSPQREGMADQSDAAEADLASSIAATRARFAALSARQKERAQVDLGPRSVASLFTLPDLGGLLAELRPPTPQAPTATEPPPELDPSADMLVQSIDEEQVRIADLFGALADASVSPSQAAAMAEEALAGLENAKASADASGTDATGGEEAPPGTEQAAAESAPAPEPAPAVVLAPGQPWPSFAPAPPGEADHLWLQSPFPDGYNQFYSPNYQFGSTANGRYRIHHGVDISNPAGTPILAPADGEVVHAGPDNPTLLGPYNNFYGNAVVIRLNRRLATPEGEQDVYVLYGHMSEVYAVRGQQVTAGEPVGAVGMTGIAIGPHLHVEVRLGQNSYLDTVNPALWMAPIPGTGGVAVRLLDAQGRTWPQARLSLLRFEGDKVSWVRTIEIYPEAENMGPDPAWGENGAMTDLRAGPYYITGKINGEKVGQNIVINPGETTFVELRTQQ